MSWFVCIFADGNKMILQRLSFQQENVKGAVKQVFSEAGIQSTPVLQTVYLLWTGLPKQAGSFSLVASCFVFFLFFSSACKWVVVCLSYSKRNSLQQRWASSCFSTVEMKLVIWPILLPKLPGGQQLTSEHSSYPRDEALGLLLQGNIKKFQKKCWEHLLQPMMLPTATCSHSQRL